MTPADSHTEESAECKMEIKNTFIHFAVEQKSNNSGGRHHSCPPQISSGKSKKAITTTTSKAVTEVNLLAACLEESTLFPSHIKKAIGTKDAEGVPSEDTTSIGGSSPGDCDFEDGDLLSEGNSPKHVPMASECSPCEVTHEEQLRAIGCNGCGCFFPVVCVHAMQNRCNKPKCRYCHCQVGSKAGAGAPARRQSSRTYMERLLAGELNGNQYVTILQHVLLVDGEGSLASVPAWLHDPKVLRTITVCLVRALAQRWKFNLARKTLLLVLDWMRPEPSMGELTGILAHMRSIVQSMPHDGWTVMADEPRDAQTLRADILGAMPCDRLSSREWPKSSLDGSRLSPAPWLGVANSLIKSFAWELYRMDPRSPVFEMNNIVGRMSADVRQHIAAYETGFNQDHTASYARGQGHRQEFYSPSAGYESASRKVASTDGWSQPHHSMPGRYSLRQYW
mmetsp:Transcript_875/g.1991  ORF Transcript_875/g.1991 Transcript_875/m.1991 type:complete len:451 (-) Transcript_875:228-1580(-)|eukprot:CAMPEP_0178419226 /NCGR_PEP_ID=MMETSP0689_2-20121128/25499_1 /TAXON_ID=160604 /ORGANISM="Amphidinium massartii, Strain CS-259" /LENGTH=450 /DNA_ID=CAMNT_0020040653 /DNA_START=32 /DNA_END=1384 /DNA_ORIENTATION=+